MSTATSVQPIEGRPAPALTPHDTADIPELNRLLSHGYSARAAIHLKACDLDAAFADLLLLLPCSSRLARRACHRRTSQ